MTSMYSGGGGKAGLREQAGRERKSEEMELGLGYEGNTGGRL